MLRIINSKMVLDAYIPVANGEIKSAASSIPNLRQHFIPMLVHTLTEMIYATYASYLSLMFLNYLKNGHNS